MLIDAENHDELPVEIYKAQVDSMFSDAKTLAIGCLASTGVTLYAAAKYQSPEICCIAAAMPGHRSISPLRDAPLWADTALLVDARKLA